MKTHFSKKEFISCLISMVLALTMVMIPYDVFAFGNAGAVEDEESIQAIKDLIAQLRQEVKDAEVSEELKEQLDEIINELEEDLNSSESELEQAAQIEQARKEMEELLKQALTKNKIGEALQKYELTRPLGEAISKGDTEKVSSSLEELEEVLSADAVLIEELAENIITALSDSGVDSEDELYIALEELASDLYAVAPDEGDEERAEKLGTAMEAAEAAIIAALEKQAAIEEQLGNMDELLSEAKDEILGNDKEDSTGESEGEKPEGEMPEGEKPEGETQEGEKPEGEMPEGEMPEGEMPEGAGEGNGEGNAMTEEIYDPISGNVSYGEVFAAYYADYLAALEAGEVTEELQELIDNYFSALD